MKYLMTGLLLLVGVIAVTFYSSYAQKKPEKINIVWLSDRKPMWEEDWVMELFSGFEIEVTEDLKLEKHLNNSIFIIGLNSRDDRYNKYFKTLHDLNYNFGIIHLSDEVYGASTEFYQYAKFVYRNYWHENFKSQKNVHFFPLGYKTGFWSDGVKKINSISDREYNWSFAGRTFNTPTRAAMVEQMKTVPDYHLFITSDFGDKKALGVLEYRDILLKSKFIPCGAGWRNLDSFRVYEALECGCIPIVEKKPYDYFTQFYGEHPFVSVDTWDQAPTVVTALLENPKLLEERRQRCHQWWLDYKANAKKQLREVVATSLNQG